MFKLWLPYITKVLSDIYKVTWYVEIKELSENDISYI